jgi:hypothetical protein
MPSSIPTRIKAVSFFDFIELFLPVFETIQNERRIFMA